ncbi:Uncharacterised protein [uncultured archaeon]|nr:Uncharacterised protein [uncultured archaeon]
MADACTSLIIFLGVLVIGASMLAGIAGIILFFTGQLFGIIYYAWDAFSEKVLGKPRTPKDKGKKANYSIDQSKPVP